MSLLVSRRRLTNVPLYDSKWPQVAEIHLENGKSLIDIKLLVDVDIELI